MRRRDFLKTSMVASGLAGSPELLQPVTASENSPKNPSQISGPTGVAREDNRSAEYLRRAQADEYLPKSPVLAKSSPSASVQISPMPLAERVRRKIVPQRGFCSLAPGNGALISGNGAVNIELACDPYTEADSFPPRKPVRAAVGGPSRRRRSQRFSRRCGKCCWTENTTTLRNSLTTNGIRPP